MEPIQYTVILEEGPESWGAYIPDLPGCVAVGESREEALHLIREAMEFHLEGIETITRLRAPKSGDRM